MEIKLLHMCVTYTPSTKINFNLEEVAACCPIKAHETLCTWNKQTIQTSICRMCCSFVQRDYWMCCCKFDLPCVSNYYVCEWWDKNRIYHSVFHAILAIKELECGLLNLTKYFTKLFREIFHSHIFFSLKKMEKREIDAILTQQLVFYT